ncbi:putative epidermal cell surface receptor [Prorops nasuta]|uniref:putative epidermal cell surface receptor n=1 Tax=Prorops nasuta TaxID=863751 RepID=UPI0034CD4E3C
MRIQRGCLLAAVGLCLLGGVTVFSETIDTGPAALSKSPTLGGIELPVVPNNHDRTSTSTEKSTSSKFFSTEASVPSRGRALDVSGPEPTNSLHANLTDLSDVSMDDEEDDRDNVQQDDKKIPQGGMVMVGDNSNMATTARTVEKMMGCVESGRNYSIGEQVKRGCEERCFCKDNGLVGDCEAVCTSPYVRTAASTNRKPDPYCKERLLPEEECCAILICENADSASLEADESCVFNNKTVPRGERIEDGCSKVCVCEAAGSLKCQPRCPPNETAIANQHDRCVVLTDPSDACCTITLCDVTLGDHEIRPETSGELTVNLTDVKVVNSTAIKLKLSSKSPRDALIEISDDNHVWREVSFDKAGIIGSLEPAHSYYVRVTESGKVGPAIRVFLPPEVTKTNASLTEKLDKNSCLYRNKTYKIGEEWYDECISFCQCAHNGQPECITIECPTDSGLDVLDPHCLDWETVPANFEPKPPHCCPQEVRCRNNGSCMYEGRSYDNWSELPKNVTGCEKRCYCEWGKITCDAACPPVKALPPATLNCPPFRAALMPLPGDDCCKQWACVEGLDHSGGGGFLSGGLGPFPVQQGNSDEVIVNTLDALDEDTVRLVFTVPAILVGLHGTVELRYTSDKANVDPSSWKVQVFAPPKNLITTQQLEFELGDLKPSTEYKVKITVKLQDLENTPTSKIYSVRTLDRRADVSTLPPQIPVDAELRISETNSTWINVVWRKFSEYELQFIDGVQLRFKELEGKVYAATPLIHRAVTNYAIENLRPDTIYEVGIDLIPFPGQTTELVSDKIIQITTATEPDPYSFDVKVEIKSIKATDVEVSWKGVPYPEDKYVNIYRAIYQSDSGKEDTSTFKIAKRDSPAKTVISDLKPGTRYRLWIEVYLTNGKIKKSNVQDFVTKPGVPSTHASQQAGKLATSPLHEGDYYGPLVIVAIVASLAILSTLILLMMLMKRRTSSKADISPRKTTSAYDNPSYKIELQQETMDL